MRRPPSRRSSRIAVASMRDTTGRSRARARTNSATASPASAAIRAELLLLCRRDADVEALREGRRSFTSERHRPCLRSAGCEKRKRRAPSRLAEPRSERSEAPSGRGVAGLGRTRAAPAACVRTSPHPAIRLRHFARAGRRALFATDYMSSSSSRIVASRKQLLAASGRQLLAGSACRLATTRALTARTQQEKQWTTPLRARIGWPRSFARFPAKDPAQRRLDKQGMVRLLAEEIIVAPATGLHDRRRRREPARARPRYHDAHAQKLPPASKGQSREALEEQASRDQAGGPRCGERDAEARQGGPLRCGGSEHDTHTEAADRRARNAAGSRSRSAPQRQGSISRQGQGQLLNERINHVESDFSRWWRQGRRGQVTDVDGAARFPPSSGTSSHSWSRPIRRFRTSSRRTKRRSAVSW